MRFSTWSRRCICRWIVSAVGGILDINARIGVQLHDRVQKMCTCFSWAQCPGMQKCFSARNVQRLTAFRGDTHWAIGSNKYQAAWTQVFPSSNRWRTWGRRSWIWGPSSWSITPTMSAARDLTQHSPSWNKNIVKTKVPVSRAVKWGCVPLRIEDWYRYLARKIRGLAN